MQNKSPTEKGKEIHFLGYAVGMKYYCGTNQGKKYFLGLQEQLKKNSEALGFIIMLNISSISSKDCAHFIQPMP